MTFSFRIDNPPPGFGPPHEDVALEALLARASGVGSLMSRRGVASPKLRAALRVLGITRRDSTSAFGLIPTPGGFVMAQAVQSPTAAPDSLRVAVRDSAFVERGTTWSRRMLVGHSIDWAAGRRFECAVFSDDQGVAFHLAGEHGTVEFAAEQLLAAPPG